MFIPFSTGSSRAAFTCAWCQVPGTSYQVTCYQVYTRLQVPVTRHPSLYQVPYIDTPEPEKETRESKQRKEPEKGTSERKQRKEPQKGARERRPRKKAEKGTRERNQRKEPEKGTRERHQKKGPEKGTRERNQIDKWPTWFGKDGQSSGDENVIFD